jgi:uncharacterized protein (TIGR02466 family)
MTLVFSVPLLVEDVDAATRDAVHAKVSRYLQSDRGKRDIEPSPEESVATSYYKRDAQVLADANLVELEQFVLGTARTFLENALKLPPRRLEIERSWINVFKPGAQEAQHSHDGSVLSCSYYVEAPKDCGCIVMPDPIGARRSYREFTKTTGSDLLTRRDIAVEPQPGRLVMFESWLPHYVQCNKSDKVRISIAMNLREAAQVEAPGPVQAAAPEGAAAPISRARSTDAGPFLTNELFEVRQDLKLSLEPIKDTIPTVVVDDFLKNPEQARAVVGSTPAANWKHVQGGKNFVDYYDCRLRFPIFPPNGMIAAAQQIIRQVYQVDTRPAEASVDVNWFKQIREKRAESAVPHNDMTDKPRRSFTCIVFLNRREECSGGTAFFRFKKTGSLVLDEKYVEAIRENPKLAETGRDYWPSDADESWERVGSIDMVPGRLLIFPSEYFHAAYHPQNSFFEFPRLTLAFWMVT